MVQLPSRRNSLPGLITNDGNNAIRPGFGSTFHAPRQTMESGFSGLVHRE